MNAAERFVATPDIRAALAECEIDVLDKLGIDWRAGNPHILCPYRDHLDRNPSWRWDEKKARAHCTCSNSDSILDVIKKVRGLSFDAAKMKAAEILGRNDLIRVNDSKGKRQSTDAHSLLNAPDADRDDSLPIRYLAHRLGVPAEAVPVPSTRIVGLKAHGYFDPPPPGSRVKPRHVGDFPACIFETRDATGNIHAHRIYVAENGLGKAELGKGPSGRPRPPKKSARVVSNDNTAGRAVLWGDPNRAPDQLLFEGIENAAAVAFAFKAEIAVGDVAVAAAITATGVEAYQPYPATKRITVGADRDEAGAGNRAGENAARSFGLKHYHQLQIQIALPGEPGTKVDWLDVLRREGVEAVRAGIMGGIAFAPTRQELDATEEAKGRAAEMKRVAETYPLPAMDNLRLEYAYTAAGALRIHKVSEVKGKTIQTPITTPFGVTARLRLADQADAYGLRVLVQDMNGQPRPLDFDRGELARLHGSEIRAALLRAGLRTEADGEQVALAILKAADPKSEIVTVGRPGWHDLGGCAEPLFIAPSGEVIGDVLDAGIELSVAARLAPDIARAGTLEGWRAAMAAALSTPSCPHWILGIVAGFCGVVTSLAGLDTAGINLSGLSSSGKTTAQRLAVSAWSSPDLRRPGLMQSARATDNAVEGLAQRASGTVLALDELAHVPGKVAAKLVYLIAAGVGKTRMMQDTSLRDSHTWSTFAVLSGENSLAEKIRADGGEWSAGMAARILDIDVRDVNRQVAGETLQAINEIDRHFGHAGLAFVRALVESGEYRRHRELRDEIKNLARELAGPGADGALVRAAEPLAILWAAGVLAISFGVIPGNADDVIHAVRWAWMNFRASSDAEPLDAERQAINHLRTWAAERWNVTVCNIQCEPRHQKAEAWFDDQAVYIPKGRLVEAGGGMLRQSQIAAILLRGGMLIKRGDRMYARYVPGVGRLDAYAIRLELFEQLAGQTNLRVYEGRRA